MNFLEEVLDTTGIYPAKTSTVDEKGKEVSSKERTKWEDGWNACYSDITTRAAILELWYNSLKDEEKEVLEFFKNHGLFIHIVKSKKESDWNAKREDKTIYYDSNPVLTLSCSDTFCWGCSDSEVVTLNELSQLKVLTRLVDDESDISWLSTAFASYKRHNMKLMPELKKEQKRLNKLVDLIKNKTTIQLTT